MDKKTEGLLQIIMVILIAAGVIYFSKDIEALGSFGYVGVFVISLLSSATLLFPAPGWAAVVAASRVFDPVSVGVVAGIGSAMGELTGYLAGEGVREMVGERIKEAKKIESLVKKYDMLGIAVLAFIPNPVFDVAGIIAGGLKIKWWKYLIACMIGRTARYVMLAMLGQFTLGLI